MPLRDDMIGDRVFAFCPILTTLDQLGINRINQVLRYTTSPQKTPVVRDWIRSVIRLLDHYKVEHKAMLKEATTLLELALWKADLNEKEEG
eukprot:CAMPEP_0113418390 /NCGR_PEP_ID=MMETSP0013_2-20120614/26180_1 /TAXON_ID=2843 ORGANISM="Skeletonema costatum, Strain 1716" /NCGR_SAMPLE_ID=MMETSP0013_2 /ASSEMBLY_ACC=CAM_ASM_000158 /LENGTH=90 /DNA_ID=CAMNT_0000305621 /DNA_START=489 /DNA_END=758 /DNA_ORIENTATION=- /assembly_acc=CAM_ASM_000158